MTDGIGKRSGGRTRRTGGRAARVTGRQEHWRGVLEAWAASGLSQAGFCRQRRLPTWKFSWWKRRLTDHGLWPGPARRAGRQARGPSAAEAVRRGSPAAGSVGPAAFVAVGQMPAAVLGGLTGASEDAMALVLPGGWRIALGCRFDAEALGRLLAVLEARPC